MTFTGAYTVRRQLTKQSRHKSTKQTIIFNLFTYFALHTLHTADMTEIFLKIDPCTKSSQNLTNISLAIILTERETEYDRIIGR